MIELPTTPSKGKKDLVKRMLIISRPKVGKTRALMQLPNSLLIDLENSAEFYDGMSINVMKEASKIDRNPISILKTIAKKIQAANAKKGDYVYDFGIIDTVTKLEELCEPYATALYQKTAAGSNFKGKNVINELEFGQGYRWLRTAFDEVLTPYFSLFKTLILLGHVKDSSINNKGKSLSVLDINLTGKIKLTTAADCDAIGTMYRDPDNRNVNILSFVTSSDDIITGARPIHLSGKEFQISELDPETKELKTNWDQIFTDISIPVEEIN